MTTSEIYELICFMNKKRIKVPLGTEIIMQSKSNKDYELTIAFNDASDTKGWKIAIDPVPYNERTMSNWMSLQELENHPAYEVSDWALEKESRYELLTALREAKRKEMEKWDNVIKGVDYCDLYVFEYPEEDDD